MAKDKGKEKFTKNVNIKNRKASFEYHFIDKYVGGLVLMGTEIKSIREGKVTMQEAFCYFKKGELWIKQMHISPYTNATHFNHESDRERKVLLQKRELRKLEAKSQDPGITIVPFRIFTNERGWAKVEVALAKGKKLFDKRDSIKERDAKRELDRIKF